MPPMQFDDVPAPPTPTATARGGPYVPPEQRIHFYSPDEWEVFAREWVTTLTGYLQIKRLGGPSDRGVDVAGFLTEAGFEGAWDCYQAKHYAEPLTLSDVAPEFLKVFRHVLSGDYQLPDNYFLLAPKGVGAALNRLLSAPARFRERFSELLATGEPLTSGLTPEELDQVRQFAGSVDFSIFKSVELPDLVLQHAGTIYHNARFGTPLQVRPPSEPPPVEIAAVESRYIQQLIDVYAERDPSKVFIANELSNNANVGTHFSRQRSSFYRAESLRMYARDSVPDGTFDALVDDVHAGVVEMHDRSHPSGFDRLSEVLTAAGAVDLSQHELITVTNVDDRKGICHHLANDDRLTWVQ